MKKIYLKTLIFFLILSGYSHSSDVYLVDYSEETVDGYFSSSSLNYFPQNGLYKKLKFDVYSYSFSRKSFSQKEFSDLKNEAIVNLLFEKGILEIKNTAELVDYSDIKDLNRNSYRILIKFPLEIRCEKRKNEEELSIRIHYLQPLDMDGRRLDFQKKLRIIGLSFLESAKKAIWGN